MTRMTYEEVKERFKEFGNYCDDYCDGSCEKCSDMEDRIIKALEKQISKKPKKLTYKPLIEGGWTYECPRCGLAVGENRFTDYEYIESIEPFCGQCGQAIDWSEVDQMDYKEALYFMTHNGATSSEETVSYQMMVEAMEKQIPKKPKVKEWIAIDDVVNTYHCPCCDIEYNKHYIGSPNCKYCGQRIDWSEVE